MPISRDSAEFSGPSFGKEKLKPGRYIARVFDCRSNDTRSQGEGFFIDFEVVKVVSGDSPVGQRASFAIFPDTAKGSVKVPVKKARALEEGKFIVALAAVCGKTRDEVEYMTQKRIDEALKRPKSPHAGKLVTVVCVPYTNKKGEETSYLELEPFLGDESEIEASSTEEEEKPATKPAASKPKGPKAPAKAKKPAFPPEGWEEVDSDGDVFYYNEESDESLTEEDLRERFGL